MAASAVEAAAGLAGEGERAAAFDRDSLIRDGWVLDRLRNLWFVPPRGVDPGDPAPDRAGAAAPPARPGGPAGSADGGGPDGAVHAVGGVDYSLISDEELDMLLAQAEAWEAWWADPDERLHRWDRRALLIGRVLRRRDAGSARPGSVPAV